MPVVMSKKSKKYFDKIEEDVNKIYEFANKARAIGIDPAPEVESPPARDMAGRVEKLVGPEGIAQHLRDWKEAGEDQDESCFRAMDWIIEGKFGKKYDPNEAVDLAIRVALAIKTEGVVSAPLEGIAKVVIRDNLAGGEPYLALYFAGPIRAAGGTVQAFAVLCAEHVRRKMGIAEWKATPDEVGRFVEEVKLYDRIMNLQYPSTQEELAFAVEHLTIELNGDATETQEVSAYRDLQRIETNFVRGGPCLVLNDGVLLKSKKILRVIDKRKIKGWDWLRKLKKLAHADTKKKIDEDGKDKAKDYGGDTYKGKKVIEEEEKVEVIAITPVQKRQEFLNEKNPPLNKFISDIIAGRPVFAYPSRIGGHRIRYGRSRNTGLAACGTHPSQMILLEKYMAIGTQIRIERPGKSGSTMPVTSIEPPIVLMKNGDVKQLWDIKEAGDIADNRLTAKILFLGDMLFGYGEFAENNHTVLPSGYCEEWWTAELEDKIQKLVNQDKAPFADLPEDLSQQIIEKMIANPFDEIPTGRQALEISRKFNVGIHPRSLDHWGNINGVDLLVIRKQFGLGLCKLFNVPKISELSTKAFTLAELETKFQDGFDLPITPDTKIFFETVFTPHKNHDSHIHIDPHRAIIFYELFGFGVTSVFTSEADQKAPDVTALDLFPLLTSIRVIDKAPHYMGSRMGRPEKAKERKMRPPVHGLFPIGHDSKLQRSFQSAAGVPYIEVELGQKSCSKCKSNTFLNKCPKCGTLTDFKKICSRCNKLYDQQATECPDCNSYLSSTSMKKIPFKKYFEVAASHIPKTIPSLKGVKGMSSEYKIPEPIEKGILRAIHDVYVYKDGTIRADATDIPLTHFTCREINTPVDKILDLGYDIDIYGKPITDETQVIEIKVQDVLLTHHLGDYFVKVANFVDDELHYLYKQPKFYNVKDRYDLVGHYMAGLAPHTSAAIIGRLIGFTYAESGYAHPYWHAAKRRNCFPGDSTVMLSIDGKLQKKSFESLYENYFSGEKLESSSFIKKKAHKDIKVYSFEKETGKIHKTNITEVIKTSSPSNLIKFSIFSGRSFSTTPDHSVIVYSEGKICKKKAKDVTKADLFILPRLPLEIIDISEIDLLEEFSKPVFKDIWDDLMIRGIKELSKKLIEVRGLAKTAELLAMNKKTLFNYYSNRNSIPLGILIKLLKLNKQTLSSVPECTFGFKRDHTFVKRFIKIDQNLMKLAGYYIAEGFYREGTDCYQVDFAAHEDDIQNDMGNCIEKCFGEGFSPYTNDYRITISNRVIYLIFKDIFKFHNTARTKSIPSFFTQLPKKKMRHLLAAYFAGDGGLDLNHKVVSCTSFSSRLIHDIDLQLLRFGIFSSISKHKRETAIEYKHRIRGKNVFKFAELIGFTSERKMKSLDTVVKSKKTNPELLFQNNRLLKIRSIEQIQNESPFVYSLNAENYHSLLINENIVTSNCDGDEDGIMLLLECLLNFSMYYLPSSLGGKMDAPLVVSLLLDPLEVDGESHNVDYASKYPLRFYEEALTYKKPSDMDSYMVLFKHKLRTEAQFEGSMFTHPTTSINLGPRKSAYTILGTMTEKIESQLYLAKTITSVDAKDVARKVISSHFAPDILGNLRAFSTQGFRCIKCGAKYRRVPISGKCNKCRAGKLLMTVHAGGVVKYLPKAQKLIKEFDLGDYTEQRWQIIEKNVMSLTNNPRVKQKSIKSFFK